MLLESIYQFCKIYLCKLMSNCDYQIHQTLSESTTWHAMGNQQSGAGGGGKDKGEQKEKKKYEPPVPTRSVSLHTEYL